MSLCNELSRKGIYLLLDSIAFKALSNASLDMENKHLNLNIIGEYCICFLLFFWESRNRVNFIVHVHASLVHLDKRVNKCLYNGSWI